MTQVDAKRRRARPRPHAPRRAAFTIVSANYIGYAATLMQSAETHIPGVTRFIILADRHREFNDIALSATLLDCDSLQIEHVDNMKAWYTVIEFNTAIKPYAFLYLFEHLGFDEVCYIDPDILLFDSMTEVFAALAGHSCVLTPHMMQPLQDGKEPSDLTIMKSGVYNLGFLGLRNDSDGRRLARWWADRCFLHCRVDIAGNMFTDQRWMDLAPALVARPFILRHPGYNLAYWNLVHREVKKTEHGEWLVNGEPLIFFHFSGINPDKPDQFSKHQNRYTSANLGIVNELCDLYRGLVLANHWRAYSKTEYGFGFFPDGRRIDEVMRHCIARSIDEARIDPKKTLTFTREHFDCPSVAAAEKGVAITRYMYQLWLDRRDLRAAFDIFVPSGLQGYYDWFLGGDAAAQGVDAASLAAAQQLRGGEPAICTDLPKLQLPPWPRVCLQVLADSSAQARHGLAQDIMLAFPGFTVRVPKQIALLWERREDLQSAFDLAIPERLQNYLCWAITNGVRDGVVDISCLSPEFIGSFAKKSAISAHYGDVPVTEGMILLRQVDEVRQFLPGWERFPLERASRLAHGLWFAFIAPRLFGWPEVFVAPLRHYFRETTATSVNGFLLNRAAIAIWELRADLQRTFPLGDEACVWRYLRWLLVDGLRELGISLDDFDPGLRSFLLSEAPRFAGVSRLLAMLYGYRPDLQKAFDLAAERDRHELIKWAAENLESATKKLPMGEALRSPICANGPARGLHRATIALTGYWAAASGRGEDLRGSAGGLDAAHYTDYVVIDLETRSVMLPGGEVLPDGTQIEAAVNIVHTNAETAPEDAATLHRMGVRAAKVIGFWAWELEWLPDYWRHAYSFYDEIWASSRFAEAAFNRDGVRPVTRVAMAVLEPRIDTEMSREELALPADSTLFVFMFDFRSFAARKNPAAVIEAFRLAFPDGGEKVHLLIKTSGAAAMPADAARLRELACDGRIELRDARLEREVLLNLVRSADAFVSLHRSEGFGRGPAEAMLLSVPVIVTDYSGSADYATRRTALLVDYELIPVVDGQYPGVTGQRWAEANVATAARHMRWVHEHRAEAGALGRHGRDEIRRLYGARPVGEGMLRALGLSCDVRQAAPGRALGSLRLVGSTQ